jgi:hypothetical protein
LELFHHIQDKLKKVNRKEAFDAVKLFYPSKGRTVLQKKFYLAIS